MLGKPENRKPAEEKIRNPIFRGARETGEPETGQEQKSEIGFLGVLGKPENQKPAKKKNSGSPNKESQIQDLSKKSIF